MASYFIDGVGDEVTIVFGIFMGIFIIVVAWLSTRVNDTRILEANDNINAVASELNRNNVANQPNGNLSQQTNLSQENSVNSTAAPANALVGSSTSSSQENGPLERQSESPSSSAVIPETIRSSTHNSNSVLQQTHTDNASHVNISPSVPESETQSESSSTSADNIEPSGSSTQNTDSVLRQRHTNDNADDVNINPCDSESTPSPETANNVSIRLKFINETVKTVQVNPDATLDQFRRSNFPAETAGRYRLIYRGQVLRNGSQTLKQLRIVDETTTNSTSAPVIHCFLSNTDVTDRSHLANSASRQLELSAEELHIGSLLLPLLGLLLTFLWYLCIFHTSLFSIQSVVSIVGFTFFYIVLLVNRFL